MRLALSLTCKGGEEEACQTCNQYKQPGSDGGSLEASGTCGSNARSSDEVVAGEEEEEVVIVEEAQVRIKKKRVGIEVPQGGAIDKAGLSVEAGATKGDLSGRGGGVEVEEQGQGYRPGEGGSQKDQQRPGGVQGGSQETTGGHSPTET